MIPGLGAYYKPDRLEEALALLAHEPQARILGGGTDLLLEHEPLHAVVDVTHLGLSRITQEPEALVVGGTTRIEALQRDSIVRAWADGVLVGACMHFGTLQVRNMATVGGNIAHALPAADLVPALLVLDATLGLARATPTAQVARRVLALDGFATGPFQTALLPGELLLAVRIPTHTRHWRAQFRKIGRVVKDLAQVNCAVALDTREQVVRTARIAVGAVHPTVTRVLEAEAEIIGATIDSAEWPVRVARAVEAVRAFIRPISDMRATREWRRHVCGVLVRRSLEWVTDPRHAGHVPVLADGPSYCVGMQPEAMR